MPVIQCRKCAKKLKVPATKIGQRGKCPACGTVQLLESESDPEIVVATIVPPPAVPATPVWQTPAFLMTVILFGVIFMCCGGCGFLGLIGSLADNRVAKSSEELDPIEAISTESPSIEPAPKAPPVAKPAPKAPPVAKPTPKAPPVAKSNRNSSKKKWYSGGNLHKASVFEWRKSSYDNKLATCSDFVTKMWKADNLKPKISNAITSVDSIRPLAHELVEFIDAATKADPDPELDKKIYTNQDVTSLAVIGMVTMKWTKAK